MKEDLFSKAKQNSICDKVENKPGCIREALNILGDKWTPILLGNLVSGPRSFSELETMLSGISPRTLSARLKKLTENNIIAKKSYNDHPPRYNYLLTEKGQELQTVLIHMADWGEKYQN